MQLIITTTAVAQDKIRISVTDSTKSAISNSTILFEMGDLPMHSRKEVELVLTNLTDTALIICNATWGEPFISPSFKNEPILKGDSMVITFVKLPYDFPGPFNKYARIETSLGNFIAQFKGKLIKD